MNLGNPALPNLARPMITYKDMIIDALRRSPEKRLKLQEIYDVIQLLHPYYRSLADNWGWQNSIRHNLSLHDCFVKEPIGGSVTHHVHYWTLDEEKLATGDNVRRRRGRSMRMAPRNETPPIGNYGQPPPVAGSIGSEEETPAPIGIVNNPQLAPVTTQLTTANNAPPVVPAAPLPNNANLIQDLINIIRDDPQLGPAFLMQLLRGAQNDQFPQN